MDVRVHADGVPGFGWQQLRDDPSLLVPPVFTLEARNDASNPLPDLLIRLETRDGEVCVASVTVQAHDHGRGVNLTDLRSVLLDDWVTVAIAQVAMVDVQTRTDEAGAVHLFAHARLGPDAETLERAERAYLRAKGRKPRSQKRQQLAEAARVYRENLDNRPIEAVMAKFGIKHRTAQQWIKEARSPEYGFLSEHTEHGRATP